MIFCPLNFHVSLIRLSKDTLGGENSTLSVVHPILRHYDSDHLYVIRYNDELMKAYYY